MDITTSWVTPPNQITGLDHLGVQAPCINIYAQLLPGITNVTDRARYYSFYPWLLMAMSDIGYKYGDDFINDFRSADALFTLICLRHQSVCNDGNHHANAAVGSIKLSKALLSLNNKESIKLSSFSSREASSDRYFKNKLGGLGQYYIGVLRSLKLMDGNAKNGVKAVKNIGGKLASSFANNLPVEKFLSVVKADEVTLDDLDELYGFCLCQLNENKHEQNAMVEMFSGTGAFKGQDKMAEDDAIMRHQSLAYMLQLASIASDDELTFDVDTFRALTYCRAINDEQLLALNISLETVVDGWASYQQNELLSMSLQGIFFTCLKSYELSGLTFTNVEDLVAWFWSKGAGHIALSKFEGISNYADLQRKLLEQMPDFTEWQEKNHEIQSMFQLRDLSKQNGLDNTQLAEMVLHALRIFSSLSGRKVNSSGYSEHLFFPKGYFEYYPVNLNSFLGFLGSESGDWIDLPIHDCLSKIVSEWCLNSHLRVALRKLRQQSQSTFRFMPSDHGLRIISIPKPAHTQPRFTQARAILKDIGLLSTDAAGSLRPTDKAVQLINSDNKSS
jgi:hypothetical protein